MKWQKRYQAAHELNFQQEYPSAYKDGHYFSPEYPKTGTANGLTKMIKNFLNWSGHFANRTNSMGTPVKKTAEKFNIMTGKLQTIDTGMEWRSSNSMKGMQDIDCNLKHPDHPYGIPWKIEIKVGRDTHKDAQIKFGKKVSGTGAVYSVIRSPEEFFDIYDLLIPSHR